MIPCYFLIKLYFEDFDYLSLFCLFYTEPLYATYASFGGAGSHMKEND